jgi:hypothetical protein
MIRHMWMKFDVWNGLLRSFIFNSFKKTCHSFNCFISYIYWNFVWLWKTQGHAMPWPWGCRCLSVLIGIIVISRSVIGWSDFLNAVTVSWPRRDRAVTVPWPCRDRAVCRDFSYSYEICSKKKLHHWISEYQLGVVVIWFGIHLFSADDNWIEFNLIVV